MVAGVLSKLGVDMGKKESVIFEDPEINEITVKFQEQEWLQQFSEAVKKK